MSLEMLKLPKKKYKTLALLAVVAVLFYLLQCLSVFQLGKLSGQRKANLDVNLATPSPFDGNEDGNELVFRARNKIVDINDKFNLGEAGNAVLGKALEGRKPLQPETVLEKHKAAKVESQQEVAGGETGGKEIDRTGKKAKTNANQPEIRAPQVLGVHASDRHLYQPDGSNMFTCLKNTGIRIAATRINDDFCDCPDSSDEPGTSACPSSKFYCTVQFSGVPPQFITSSKVNDGICDCCDGSDEWAGALVPEYIRIKEGDRPGAVFHAPCSDKCNLIISLRKNEEEVRKKGRLLQAAYLRMAAKELTEKERLVFGPNGIFYPLSKTCYTLKDSKYEYNVCPFVKVTQQSFPHPPMTLGSSPHVGLDKGQHLLEMSGGDNSLCPFGRSRKAKIYLLCGLEDKLLKVAESELCEYTFTMSSPAAC